MGGSTLRIALVTLHERNIGMQIQRTMYFPIDTVIRQLKEFDFFDWMAGRIGELLEAELEVLGHTEGNGPLPMGVA